MPHGAISELWSFFHPKETISEPWWFLDDAKVKGSKGEQNSSFPYYESMAMVLTLDHLSNFESIESDQGLLSRSAA